MTTIGMPHRTGVDLSRPAERGATRTTKSPAGTTAPSTSAQRPKAGSSLIVYSVDASMVTMSLLSDTDGSQIGESRTVELEDHSPEQVGLTVPVLWDLIDKAKARPESVVLIGDVDTKVVPPIVELAMGVPVISVDAPVAADVPAAEADTESTPAVVPPVDAPKSSSEPDVIEPAPSTPVSLVKVTKPIRPRVSPARIAAVSPPVTPVASGDARASRRGLVIAAALTAVVLASGVGVAVAMAGNDAPTPAATQTPSPVVQSVAPTADAVVPTVDTPAPAPISSASAPVVDPAPAAAIPAPVVSANDDGSWSGPVDQAPSAQPSAAATAAPIITAPPISAPAQEAPATRPQFTVPVPVPDPNNPDATPQELQDKAWADHWDNTFRYIKEGGQ